MPSPAHILQRRQRVKQQETHKPETMEFKIGTLCYARKYSQNTEEEKWVPGVLIPFGAPAHLWLNISFCKLDR